MKNKKSGDSKIEFSFENIHFSCQGENDWVEKQLNNMLSRIPALLSVQLKNDHVDEGVIDVKEEDVSVAEEVIVKIPKIKVAKIPKAAKSPKVKVPKTLREAKEPKIKTVKEPKIAKTPKVKTIEVPKENRVIGSALSQFISDKKVTNNQVRKFLATAVFLAKSNDITKLSTPMVSKALKSNGIEKLQNASDCLNKNEKKGYCIKDGREFVITENGYLSIK